MESGFYYVEKLKITNFLSFFGKHEVNLLPFTAITCNYPEGKEDMIRATEFVFGANLKQMLIENPKSLLHKALWKEYDERKEISCFVEVTINLVSDDKNLKFYRGINKCKVEYKINDVLVSNLHYEECLNDFYLNIKSKNIILHKSFFNNAIWGTPEDLETIITKILRVNSCYNKWKKAMAKVEDLREVKNLYSFEKILQRIKKSHVIVEKFVDHFNKFVTKRNYFLASVAEEESVEVLIPSFFSTSVSKTVADENLNSEQTEILQDKYESLLDNYKILEMRENKVLWEMYLFELKISSNPHKSGIWQERIKALKEKSKKYENFVSTLWTKTKEVDRHLHEISFEISSNLAILRDLERTRYLKIGLTKYGRLIDYLQTNNFVQLLRKILGENILYGNLCDDMETAVACLKHLAETSYGGRETFIIFENYSFEFKDLLLATAEDGIHINSVQELLIFLCKLKQYGLIATVPVIAEEKIKFELKEGKYCSNDIIYPEDGIFFQSDGIMGYYSEIGTDSHSDFEIETLMDRTNQLMIEQELKNEEYTSLVFQKYETIQKMVTLENDILYLKKFKRHTPRHFAVTQKLPLPDVYNEYLTNFESSGRSMELLEEEIISSEECLSEDVSGISRNYLDDRTTAEIEDALNTIRINSKMIVMEKEKMKIELKKLEKELTLSRVFTNKVWFAPLYKQFPGEQPKKTCGFYYDMELEKCRALMSLDEINEFESWKDWRMETINSIDRNFKTDAGLLKTLKREANDLAMTRKRTIDPILEHCNLNLSSAINFILDTSKNFLQLEMDQNGLKLLSSLYRNGDNTIEIGHFNTFFKFLIGLSLFLEIANYDNVPLLLLDNLQEFLPIHKDSYEAILGSSLLNNVVSPDEHINFQMTTKIALYLNFFIEMNKDKTNAKKNGKKGNYGPGQIIYFTSDDLVHAAQCHLWIRHNLLPDEYISEECDSYSVIEEVHFE